MTKATNYETFDHWSTTPVQVKSSYKPENYSPQEWALRKLIDRKNDPLWEHAAFEHDYSGLDM